MPKHSIKLVVLDYYMSSPIPGLDVTYSEFRSSTVSQVPVLRCFGSTEHGKKICLHIHGVFPYLYIPYDGRGKPEDLMYKLASAIDKTINVQFNQANSLTQHVYNISLVSGIPMYGFHPKTHQFFKIYLYNPNLVSRVGGLLLNRNILGEVFQPHEIHLNYTLQFMIDFNLHGMSDISVSEMKFRFNPDVAESGDLDGEEFLPRIVEKSSVCELEGDVLAENILNRDEVLSGNLAVNPGIAALWEDERQRKRDKGLTSQFGDFLELKRVNVPPTQTHLMFHQALKERLASTSLDKDIVKENPDASIYPAETPSNATIQNASILDIRRSSLDLSLNDTMFLNETLTQNDPTLDEEALNFLQILEQLAEEKVEEKEQEEPQEDDEDEIDLSMPLGSVTTPIKSAPQPEEDLDSTLIPQIDGMHDDDEKQERKFKRARRSMPTLEDGYVAVDKLNLKAYVKLQRLDISKYLSTSNIKKKSLNKTSLTVDEALRKLRWRIKMIQSRNRVARLGRVFKRRVGDLNNWKSPKFKLRPAFSSFTKHSLQQQNHSIIQSLLSLTNNYIYPDLHLLLKTPHEAFILHYKGCANPEVTPIPLQLHDPLFAFLNSFNSNCLQSRSKRAKSMVAYLKPLSSGFKKIIPNPKAHCDQSENTIIKVIVEKSTKEPKQASIAKPTTTAKTLEKPPSTENVQEIQSTSRASFTGINYEMFSSQFFSKVRLQFFGKVAETYRGFLNCSNSNYNPKLGGGKGGAASGGRLNGSLINLYANCDGAFDTSSSEEDGKSLKIKQAKKNVRSTPYPPLKIITSSQASGSSQNNTKGIAEKLQPVSDFHIESSSARTSKDTVSYKRQLFSTSEASISPLNHTTTQEFLSCAYTSKSNFSSTLQLSSQTVLNHSSSDSDLFSGDEANNLTISEKYDKTINITAKPGCSTVQTPSSATSSDIPAAQAVKKTILKAPTRERVEVTLGEYNIPQVRQLEPFYSHLEDYAGSVEVGQKTLRVPSKTTAHLPEFDSMVNALEELRKHFLQNVAGLKWNSNNVRSLKLAHSSNKSIVICPVKKAPTVAEVLKWSGQPTEVEHTPKEHSTKLLHIPTSPEGDEGGSDVELSLSPDWPKLTQQDRSCQISGVTPNHTYGFDKSVQDMQAVRAVSHHLGLTTMVMELHVRTRADLRPDPQLDQVCAVFYSMLEDSGAGRGVIAVNCLPAELGVSRPDFLDGLTTPCDILLVSDEESLINSLVNLVRQKNPDILAGYEIEMLSWGFLIERASVLSINLTSLLSRSQLHKFGKSKLNPQEFETNIIGRIVLNVWRSMRHEVALQSYTFESVVYHILHRRLAMYPFKELTFWWDHRSNLYRHRVVRYYLLRVDVVLELFEKLDFLNRTSELASLFGIQFYEVLSRGSQFRVESMMLRLAKPLNFVPVSPDTRQRAHMRAPEFIPLVMEPESKLYTDPVIVLDFQSLYPSMMIAYNYCFTTCVGRISKLGSNHPFEFGATQLKVPRKLVRKLCERDLLSYSPCGVAFVKQKVREGILPRMLKEVLDTRLMVKSSMKENKGNDTLQKVLHNRQLGLKLIANVTYGYTAANFSGRMCCVEVGDSVVSKGRETLQRAIAMVENNKEWDAKVVYGDTDSLFVLVPGRTKEVAFEIGKKIAEAVTADNPDPVKLKLEKVYQPCILQTKKRYVGLMYESPEEKQPVYEAKGIETVRRDGCPAVSKMLQKCLMILFNTKDVSLVKKYVVKQFSKIQAGRASIQDLTFAKEYRGFAGYRPGACVPALELARKWISVDKRSEPRRSERVPYVIVHGHPGLPLIRLVRSPRDLLADSSLRPNALYYITKVIIPPLNRCLNLIGADALLWFNQMPRKNTHYLPNSSPIVKSTISQYFVSKLCAACGEPCMEGLCLRCSRKPQEASVVLHEKLRGWEESYQDTLLICQSCTGNLNQISCASLDCPVLYRRTQTHNDLLQANYVRDLLDTFPVFLESNYFDTG